MRLGAPRVAIGLRSALRLDPGVTDFRARGFRTDRRPSHDVLRRHADAFVSGYNLTLHADAVPGLHNTLGDLPAQHRGFAYEGAGMGCAVLDLLTVSRGRRVGALLEGPGARYAHLIHVGVGWGLAKLRRPSLARLPGLHPLLRWLALDGQGFAAAFFARDPSRVVHQRSSRPCDARCAIRHQGIGRCLWFVEAADVFALARRVEAASARHRGDLWSGIGLAAAYAGGATDAELRYLAERCEPYGACVAQGAAFAAKAHLLAGPLPPHTQTATTILAGAPPPVAAAWTDRAAGTLESSRSADDYQTWRRHTRELHHHASGRSQC